MKRILILLALLFVPVGVHAEVTTVTQNGLVVTWYPVQEGITHFAYNISVQNLQGTNRDMDISTLISDTSFDLSQLKNVKFYEWKNVSLAVSVPTYMNQSYDYTYVDNATGQNLTKTRWSMVQTGTAAKTAYALQWKPSKMQSFERTASVYKERMSIMNVPKYESKVKGGTKNGTKWFRLEFDAPIQKLASGWGSSGKVAFEIDGLEYHPWWGSGSVWQYRRLINITNNNDTQALEAGYTVNISINTSDASKFRPDGNDVRIVFFNGSYPGGIELDRVNTSAFGSTSQNTTIGFKLQEAIIEGGHNDTAYYVYYGNPDAGGASSDGGEVYLFYDDFEGTSLDPNWNLGSASVSVANSLATITVTSGCSGYSLSGIAWNISQDPPFVYEAKMKPYNSGDSPTANMGLITTAVPCATSYQFNPIIRTGPQGWYYNGDGVFNPTTQDTQDFNLFYIGRIKAISTSHIWAQIYYLNGTPSTTISEKTDWNGGGKYFQLGAWSTDNKQDVDWVRVRKYIVPEPTTYLGEEELNLLIVLENSTYTPGHGDAGDTFNFTIDVGNPDGDSVNATLFINDAATGSDTVSANSTASVLWTAPASGNYTYHWGAASSNSTGRYPESGEATGPVVYAPSYRKSVDVPGGVSKLMCTAIWTGLYNTSGVTIALTGPDGTLYQEFGSNTTTRRKIIETIIPLAGLANYNITRYDGITKMSISPPAKGTWTFKVTDANVTSFETDVDIS